LSLNRKLYVDIVTIVFKQKTLRRYGNDGHQTEDFYVDMVTIVIKQKTLGRYGNCCLKTED